MGSNPTSAISLKGGNKIPYKDKKKQSEACIRYKRNKVRWLREIKLERGCDLCGYNKHSAALQYHHLDSTLKVKTVSRMVNQNLSKEDVLKEVAKCQLLCANCHYELHSPLCYEDSVT